MGARVTKTVLILEDEPLIALDHDYHVEKAGFPESTIISSCASAVEWLQSNTPSAALLDISLRDGPSTSIAKLLADRGVPFVVCSGSTMDNADPIFLQGIWVSKPCIPDDLVNALTQAKAKVAG